MSDEGWEKRMAETHRKPPAPSQQTVEKTQEPPNDDLRCNEWRFNPHHGWMLFRICPWSCDHEHHEDEIWLASPLVTAAIGGSDEK